MEKTAAQVMVQHLRTEITRMNDAEASESLEGKIRLLACPVRQTRKLRRSIQPPSLPLLWSDGRHDSLIIKASSIVS